MKYIKNMNTKIGMITIIEEENQIIAIEINKKREEECIKKDTLLLKETEKQLMEYLEGKRREFNVPYGEVRTYKQIAEKVGNPKAARAVGMANHRNPIPIMIPCHRVIGSNGKLVGYALGMEKKRYLLEWEKKNNV